MKKGDSVQIGDIYGKMLNTVKYNLKESKTAFGEFKGEKKKDADGYNEPLDDDEDICDEEDEEETKKGKFELFKKGKKKDTKKQPKKKGKPSLEDTDDDPDEDSDEDSDDNLKESKKDSRKRVNTFMSKSVFDKLYSKVLKENFGEEDGNDIDALGLDGSTPDSDLDDDFGGEDEFGEGDGDTVTFTLDRATAQTLIDVLQGSLGEEEGGGEDEFGGDDLDFGDEDMEDMDYEEDEEEGTKVAPDKKQAFQSKSNKVSGHPAPKSGKASSDVTDETGTKDGAPSFAALQGKNNQVPKSSLKKATDYFQ